MFGFMRRRGRGRGRHGRPCGPEMCDGTCRDINGQGVCVSLAECPEGSAVTVTRNTDAKTLEMGLFPGMEVHVLKNSPSQPSILVAVGESRYVLHRNIAAQIRVKEIAN